MIPAVSVLLLSVGCASGPDQESAVARNDAIDDYIKVSEIEEIDRIRRRDDLYHEVLTNRYIILRDRKDAYLATFSRPCHELEDLGLMGITPDIRRGTNDLHARFDTYRGCRIQSLFKLSEGQAIELSALGEKARE